MVAPPQNLLQQFSLSKFHSQTIDKVGGSLETLHFRSLSRRTDASRPLNLTYSLALLNVDGIALPSLFQNEKSLAASSKFSLQVFCSWFDLYDSCFFGETYRSPILVSTPEELRLLENGKLKANLEQFELLFQSPSASPNVALVIEYVLNVETPDFKTSVSAGWSPILIWNPSFSSGLNIQSFILEQDPETKSSFGERLAVGVAIYSGSPRVLTLLEKKIDVSLLKTFLAVQQNAKLTIDLVIEPALRPLALYLPDYKIISTEDELPGVQFLPDIRISSTFTIHFSSIRLNYSRAVDLFEDSLLDIASHIYKKNGVQRKFFVLERRLTMQLHNGSAFITPPNTISLQPTDKNSQMLKFSGSVSFDKFSPNADIYLFIVLEYALLIDEKKYAETKSWIARRFSSSKLKELAKIGVKKHIVLGYTKWKPPSSISETGTLESINFNSDPSPNPLDLICLSPKFITSQIKDEETFLLADQPPISLSFISSSVQLAAVMDSMYDLSQPLFRTSRSQPSSPTKNLQDIDLSAAPSPIGGPLEPITEIFESKPTVKKVEKFVDVQVEEEEEEKKMRVSKLELSTATSFQLSRAQRARLMTADFEMPRSFDGSPITVVFCESQPSKEVSSFDNQSSIQNLLLNYELTLMGMTLVDEKVRIPENLFFTFKFYSFPIVSTPPASLSVSSDFLKEDEDVKCEWPGLLHMKGSKKCGVYNVFKSTWDTVNGMINWIAETSEIIIEVWDADTHFKLGWANVTLLNPDTNKEFCFAMDSSVFSPVGTLAKEVGVLHYRISSTFCQKKNISGPLISMDTCVGRLPNKDTNFVIDSFAAQFSSKTVLFDHRRTASEIAAEYTCDVFPTSQNLVPNEKIDLKMEAVDKFRSVTDDEFQGGDNPSDLKMIREKSKMEIIMKAIDNQMTAFYKIHKSVGRSQFFEYRLFNPFTTDITIQVSFNDQDLRIINDSEEWKSLRKFHNIEEDAPPESDFIYSYQTNRRIWLKGSEELAIPFIYQGSLNLNDDSHSYPKFIEVNFFEVETNEIIAKLSIQVEKPPKDHIITDKYFRYFSPEFETIRESLIFDVKDVLKKSNWDSNQVFIRSSHDNVICEADEVDRSNSSMKSLKFKYRCGRARNKTETFYILFYADKNMHHPCSIWEIIVHPLYRMDVSGTLGDDIKASLICKIDPGLPTSTVDCWSASDFLLRFPRNSRMEVLGGALNEIKMILKPRKTGDDSILVNLVDANEKFLVQSWIIKLHVKSPAITKEFRVSYPRPGEKPQQKKISFKNTFTQKRIYVLTSTDECKISVVEPKRMEIQPGKTTFIKLLFHPASDITTNSGNAVDEKESVYVVISNQDGEIEECLAFQTVAPK